MAAVDEQAHPGAPSISTTISPERSKLRSALVEILQTVVLTLLIFFLVRSVVQNFRVEGASMDPTLHTGQYLLINKILYLRLDGTPLASLVEPEPGHADSPRFAFGGPRRGDIIVFHEPGGSDRDFIKRVIGLPGEMVRIDNGRVYVNDEPLEEPYLVHRARYDFDEIRVPEGQYFVLGDNRPNSSDSHLGWFVRARSIVGRAWISYFPPTDWGMVDHAADSSD